MLQTIIIISIVSYLLGSIPWALIIVKISTKTDIREKGSGNIGAMNSYEITRKKWIGITVMLLDMGKGIAAVMFARLLTVNYFPDVFFAPIFAVLGHNFNIFLKFKGGRGLATLLGAFALINPYCIFLWVFLWVVGYFVIKRNVHVGNVTASILSPIFLWNAPDNIITMFNIMPIWFTVEYKELFAITMIIVLLRHIQPIVELIKGSKKS
jgi:acyl phosphate:glycerol-3-phosphate acyltransferase